MNLFQLNMGAINRVVPMQPIAIHYYIGQINLRGTMQVQYAPAIYTKAQIEVENERNLQHENAVNYTENQLRFYINTNILTGLNRSLNDGGDFIVYKDYRYKIIAVPEQFGTGWTRVTGQQAEKYV